MAHNLNFSNNRYSFAYNAKNGLPWHGLGQQVSGCMTWQDAAEKAGLNWNVSKHQLKSPIDNSLIDAYGIFRDDNKSFLGGVGGVYTIIQNKEAFDFVDTLLEAESGAHYDTAGVLGNGERIFVSASIPYAISPDRAPDDKTNCFLMFETSHDGTMSATAKLTTVRVVCNNTLNQALSQTGFGTLKVRHSASGQAKLDAAKKMLTGVKQTVGSLKEKFDALANRKINPIVSMNIMNSIFGKDWKESAVKKNQIERIAHLFDNNDNNAFPEVKGSAYNLLQAFTNWSDHERTVRRTDSVKGLSESDIRAQSAVFNGGDKFKQEALEVIMQETKECSAMPERKIVMPVYSPIPSPVKTVTDDILAQMAI